MAALTVSDFLRNTNTIKRRKTNVTGKDGGFSAPRSIIVVRLIGYGPGK
jgi:hypothetical protein